MCVWKQTVFTLIAAITFTPVIIPTQALGRGVEEGPTFTGGEITVSGGSTWNTPAGPASDVATSTDSIEPQLAEGSGSTSGDPVEIAGNVSVTGTITSTEGLFSQYVIDFYVVESASIGTGVDGVVDLQLHGEINLMLDQPYAFEISQRGPAGIAVAPDLEGPNPGAMIGNLLLPGAYKVSIDSAIVLAEAGDLTKQTTWIMTLTGQGPNSPPECLDGVTVNLWPPNHQYVAIDLNELAGAIDPDDDSITYTITSITQDEPSNSTGDGDTTCDGAGEGGDIAMIRAERKGNGNGRVYHINYIADDGQGGTCEGVLLVTVPHSSSQPAVDSGQDYVSNECVTAADITGDGMVNIDDLLWVIHSWGFTGPDETLNWPDADANISGVVDVTDLLIVIDNWGSA